VQGDDDEKSSRCPTQKNSYPTNRSVSPGSRPRPPPGRKSQPHGNDASRSRPQSVRGGTPEREPCHSPVPAEPRESVAGASRLRATGSEVTREPVSVLATEPEVTRQPVSVLATEPEVTRQPVSVLATEPEVTRQPLSVLATAPEVTRQPLSVLATEPEVTRQPLSVLATARGGGSFSIPGSRGYPHGSRASVSGSAWYRPWLATTVRPVGEYRHDA
jgi:hypothetical protein